MKAFLPAVIAAAMVFYVGNSFAADPVGRVDSAYGSPQMLRDGQPQPASEGASLFVGDEFVTGKVSLFTIRLANRTVLVMGSQTGLKIKNFSNATPSAVTLSLSQGSLNVSTLRNGNSTAMVATPLAAISIAGGQSGIVFNPEKDSFGLIVRNDDAHVSITFFGRSVIVPRGESMQITPDGTVLLLPQTAPELQNLPILPQIDSSDPLMRDIGVPELRIEPVPTPSQPSPPPPPTAGASPTPTVAGTPASTATPTPQGSPTPTLSLPPTPTDIQIPTPSPPQPTPTVLTPTPPAPTPTESSPTQTPPPTAPPTPSVSATPTGPTLTPPPPTATPTPVSPF